MTQTLHVQNLDFRITVVELMKLFEKFGTLSGALILTDRLTGMSLGIAFVDMDDGAKSAIDALNGTVYCGRPLVVTESTRSVTEVMNAETQQRGQDP
jgi:RNA recognition motif-containing protein